VTYDAVKTCKVGKDAGEQRDNWGVFMYPTHTFFTPNTDIYDLFTHIFHVMMNYVALYYVINHIILRNKSYGSVCASFGGGCE
jgi:hypothetical protein